MSEPRDLSTPPPLGGRRFQVLALSGGGARGLYTACVLEGLEERAGAPLGQCFDLIAGTSIGGIIALGLALGHTAAEVREAVEEGAPRVFPGGAWRGLAGLFGARYPAGPLRQVIENVVGGDTRMRDLKVPVLVPAVALTAGASQSFRTPHHGAHEAHGNTRLVDVALSTAAAPLVFPVSRIGNAEYVDGGLVAHAPDALALHEARAFFGRRSEDVFMLSVGTTRDMAALPSGGSPSRGLLWWMRRNRLMETIMGAQQALSQQTAREALGDRYVAINTPRSRHQAQSVGLDRADARSIATLKAMATHALEQAAGNSQLSIMLTRPRSPAAPCV